VNVICSYSSLSFSCEHFPGQVFGTGVHHPVFYLPQKKLLPYIGKFFAGELTDIDAYLLYVAALKSSDLVHFRTSAIRTASTKSLVANHLEPLFHILCKLNAVTNPHVVFPHYVISQDTKDLSTTPFWIQNWVKSYKDYQDGVVSIHDSAKLIRREYALERMIRNPHKAWNTYASPLAEWASIAGEFPTFSTINRFNGKPCTLSEYWQEIIIKCNSETAVWSINTQDLEELTEHCREHIVNIHSGIFSQRLFAMLEKARDKLKNFLGLGDLDVPAKTSWEFPGMNESVEVTNMRGIIQSAPMEKPLRENYPTKFAFIKALMNWDMSQKYASSNSTGESNV
jgi:hypothetical protein